jgi:hypothetical protein
MKGVQQPWMIDHFEYPGAAQAWQWYYYSSVQI